MTRIPLSYNRFAYHIKDVVQTTDPLTLLGVVTSNRKDSWRIWNTSATNSPLKDGMNN